MYVQLVRLCVRGHQQSVNLYSVTDSVQTAVVKKTQEH